jgi:hypothetical protein
MEILNEKGHVLDNKWIEWTSGIVSPEFTAVVANEPNARYLISEVEYTE